MKLTNKKYEIESELQADAIKLIESLGGYVIKLHISSYQKKGTPDLIVCYKGRFVALELKVKDNKPSAIQINKINKIKRAGGIAKSVWSLEEIKEILDEISRV